MERNTKEEEVEEGKVTQAQEGGIVKSRSREKQIDHGKTSRERTESERRKEKRK